MPLDPAKVESIFNAALPLQDAAARRAYLATACGGDTALRERVESLLKAHRESPASFMQPDDAKTFTSQSPGNPDERPGTLIGPYKLLEQIGEGGFGTVYMAEQEAPLRRKVALKIIKPGMDTRQVIARFEAERQALALMDHPHIAQVFDAGHSPPSKAPTGQRLSRRHGLRLRS